MRGITLAITLLVLLCSFVAGEDLYEMLGVSSSVTPAQLKKRYRKLAVEYHPDKQSADKREAVEDRFVQITNAYRVLSDPDRREKYDLYGIADEEGFKNFDDAFRFSHEGVEDSWTNWLGLILIVSAGIIPVAFMRMASNNRKSSRKKRPTKPVKK